MADWDALMEAAETAEENGNYRQALGFFNELLASAKRTGHDQMIEYCKSKIERLSSLL